MTATQVFSANDPRRLFRFETPGAAFWLALPGTILVTSGTGALLASASNQAASLFEICSSNGIALASAASAHCPGCPAVLAGAALLISAVLIADRNNRSVASTLPSPAA